jgi:hypothetical protein
MGVERGVDVIPLQQSVSLGVGAPGAVAGTDRCLRGVAVYEVLDDEAFAHLRLGKSAIGGALACALLPRREGLNLGTS